MGDSYGKLNYVNFDKYLLNKDNVKRIIAHEHWIT